MSLVSKHLDNLLGQRGALLYGGYVNMLKTMESVFLSPKHWVLEFLQNAEDAAAKRFSIRLEQDSLWILNDGKEFSADDFHAICDVKSRKLPSLGFRGYIGIGFKSIFRITNRIDIHSGELHFKFDKEHWQQPTKQKGISISEWPWEILPVEISMVALPEGYSTGFHVSLASKKGQKVLQEISQFLSKEFLNESILLLKNVEVIKVQTPQTSFSVSEEVEKLETLPIGEKEVVAVKKKDDRPWEAEQVHYLVFRKTVHVPPEVRQDEETERVRRSEISEREIGLIFGLDSEKNLQALSGKLSGVYSFLPVEGEQTGLPFGIFGDLIPQLGRDLINYGAEWNRWMCGEVVRFFKQVVRKTFLVDPLWRFFPAELLSQVQYSSISGPGKEFWNSRLRDPIKEFLDAEALYPDDDGKLRRLDELVIVTEEVVQVIGKNKLEALTGKKLAHASIIQSIRSRVEVIEIGDLSNRREFLESLKGQPEKLAELPIDSTYALLCSKEMLQPLKDEPKRLATAYRRIAPLKNYRIGGRRGRDAMPLHTVPFVLAEDGEFYPPNQMIMLDIDLARVPEFLKVVLPVLSEKKRLHPEIAKDREVVRGLENCHLEIVDRQRVMWKLQQLIKGITAQGNCPKTWKYPDDLIQATLFLIAEAEILVERLVAQDGTLQKPKDLFIPGAPLDWAPLWQEEFLPGFQPVHEKYFTNERLELAALQLEQVHQYLGKLGTHGFHRDEDKRLSEVAGYAIAEKRLNGEGHKVARVTDHHELGYDLQCQGHCGKVFEVKGMIEPKDQILPESEVTAAQQKKEDYVLVFVYNLPTHPDRVGYKAIPDPERIWQPLGRARIPKDKWFRI